MSIATKATYWIRQRQGTSNKCVLPSVSETSLFSPDVPVASMGVLSREVSLELKAPPNISSSVMTRRIEEGIQPSLPSALTYQRSWRKGLW